MSTETVRLKQIEADC